MEVSGQLHALVAFFVVEVLQKPTTWDPKFEA
jgi:hypothetical protein